MFRLIGRSLTCVSLCLIGASSLGCSSDNDGSPQGSAGAGGSPTGSAGAGGMLGGAGAMGTPGGSGPGGSGQGGAGAAASAQVQFVLKEVH